MTVTNKQLSILAGVALVMVAVTVALYRTRRTPRTDAQKGALLIQGLELDKVAKITLKDKDKTLGLARRGKGFVVVESSSYPADTKKINELLTKCLEIRIADKITGDRANHAELGVSKDSEDATIVRFYGEEISARHILIADRGARDAGEAVERPRTEAKKLAEKVLEEARAEDADFAALAEKHSDGPSKAEGGNLGILKKGEMPKKFEEAALKLESGEISDVVETALGFHIIKRTGSPLVGFVAGKSATRGSGSYVRLIGQDTVYASEKSLHLSTTPTSFMETEVVDGKKDDVKEVKVQLKGESYTIARDKDDKIVLKKIPKGKQAKSSDVESAFDALSYLSFSDVVPAAKADVKWDATYTCQLKKDKHATYVAQLAKKDDKHYLQIAARGPSPELIQKSRLIRKDAPKEELKKKDAVLTANDKAIEFTAKHRGWAYEVSSWKAEKMRKPLSELIEDIPKPTEPEEIAASHILIAYKGAERADAKVKRTKDEAKKLAEEVLKKAKAKDADFAALAKKHSDGPSKTKGGDLGTFKKEKMHKNFEEAAWKLEVGKISDVVETPFGFHIIKRTK
jgi:parvulin-like peptidyl-prolyl isomerase